MTVRINNDLFRYFRNSAKLTVSVNKISEYMDLPSVEKFMPLVSFSEKDSVPVEIDENELVSEELKNEKLFVLMAIYAMGIGEQKNGRNYMEAD